MLVVPCLGFGPVACARRRGFHTHPGRASDPRTVIVGVSYTHGFLPMLRLGPGELQLDALLTEDGGCASASRRRRTVVGPPGPGRTGLAVGSTPPFEAQRRSTLSARSARPDSARRVGDAEPAPDFEGRRTFGSS